MNFLEGSALSDCDKHELLDMLWAIVSRVAQMGFGVHPVQHAKENGMTCGKLLQNAGVERIDLIDLKSNEIGGQL